MPLGSGSTKPVVSSLRRRFLSAAGLALTTVVTGCLGGNGEQYEVQHHSLQEGPFNTYVTGNVKNPQDDTVTITITATFLGENDEEIGTGSITKDVEPNVSSKFEVTYEGDDASRVSDYELQTRVVTATA